jgi:hypothetical protein
MDLNAATADIDDVLDSFRHGLGELSASDSRHYGNARSLCVVLGGYAWDENRYGGPFLAKISNYHDDNGQRMKAGPEFRLLRRWLQPGEIAFDISGADAAFTAGQFERFENWRRRGLFASGDVPEIEKCLVALIRDAAETPNFGRYIGKNCVTVSVALDKDRNFIDTSMFWGETGTNFWMSPVIVTKEMAVEVIHVEGINGPFRINPPKGAPPAILRTQRPKSKCRCGSGKQFRRCCGRGLGGS